VGVGYDETLEEAKRNIKITTYLWEPSANQKQYQSLFEQYFKLPLLLQNHYAP